LGRAPSNSPPPAHPTETTFPPPISAGHTHPPRCNAVPEPPP
uniref:Uncharacterized protein n=1 Tax=Aegilops tauschii subsp. strangulata TaxID=200361 RepID=A0A453KGC9_AEGTS